MVMRLFSVDMFIANLSALSMILASNFVTEQSPVHLSSKLNIYKSKFMGMLHTPVSLFTNSMSLETHFEKNIIKDNSEVTDCKFINCGRIEENGGAIECDGWNLNVTGCHFIQCKGNNCGGAIYFTGADLRISSVVFEQCFLFTDVSGVSGCCLYVSNGKFVGIDNCTVIPFDGFRDRAEIFVECTLFRISNVTYDAAYHASNSFIVLKSEVVEAEKINVTKTDFVASNVALYCDAGNLSFSYCSFSNITGNRGVAITFARPNCNILMRNTTFVYVGGSSLYFSNGAILWIENYCFSKDEGEEISGASWRSVVAQDGYGHFNEGLCIPGRRFSVAELWVDSNTVIAATFGCLLGICVITFFVVHFSCIYCNQECREKCCCRMTDPESESSCSSDA